MVAGELAGMKKNKEIEFSLGEALVRHGSSAGIYRPLAGGAARWTQKVYSWLRESDPPHKHSPLDSMELYLLQTFYNFFAGWTKSASF